MAALQPPSQANPQAAGRSWEPFHHRRGDRHKAAADLALRVAEVRSRAASLPGPGQVRALEAAALAKPRATMTAAEIRALAEEAIAHLHQVAGKLAELSALLGDDETGEGKP